MDFHFLYYLAALLLLGFAALMGLVSVKAALKARRGRDKYTARGHQFTMSDAWLAGIVAIAVLACSIYALKPEVLNVIAIALIGAVIFGAVSVVVHLFVPLAFWKRIGSALGIRDER